ncbi:MAG: hypothetical protein RR033_05120 [Clostridia bacterium]
MAFIILGVVSVYALLGGGQSFFKQFGLNSISTVIFLTIVIIGNIIPPIRLTANFSLSIGGSLIIVYALLSIFYHNKFATQLYIIYISAFLGFAFYFLGRYLLNSPTGLFNTTNYLLLAGLSLAVSLFSVSPKNAFSIGVFSITMTDLIFSMQMPNSVYILGGNGSFLAMVAVSMLSIISLIVILSAKAKVYPSRKEMIYEASEELFPDEEDEKPKNY